MNSPQNCSNQASNSDCLVPSDKVFVIKHATLMSQGIWNDVFYSKSEIEKAFLSTDWEDKNNTNLFLDHKDLQASEWLGQVRNMSFEGDTLYGDLYVYDPIWIPKLQYGKPKFGISPKVEGGYDDEKKSLNSFTYKNFSLVVNPAVKKAYLNNMEVLEMSETTVDDLLKAEASKAKVEAKPLSDEEILAKAKQIEETMLKNKLLEEKIEDVFDLLNSYASKNLSVASITSKARQIRENNELWKDAVIRAAKLEELDMEKIAEEAKKQEETVVADSKKETETIDSLKAQLSEMQTKVKELNEKLYEPESKNLVKQEIKHNSKKDACQGMLEYLQEFDKEVA